MTAVRASNISAITRWLDSLSAGQIAKLAAHSEEGALPAEVVELFERAPVSPIFEGRADGWVTASVPWVIRRELNGTATSHS